MQSQEQALATPPYQLKDAQQQHKSTPKPFSYKSSSSAMSRPTATISEDEVFKPSSDVDLGMLENIPAASGNALSRQSLYLKFDPLSGGSAPGSASHPQPQAKTGASAAAAAVGSDKLLDFATPEIVRKTESLQLRESADLMATPTLPVRSGQTAVAANPNAGEAPTPTLPQRVGGLTSAAAATLSNIIASATAAADASERPTQSKSSKDLLAGTETPRSGLRYTEADMRRKVDEAVKQAHEETEILQMEIEDLRAQLNAERADNMQMRSVVEEYEKAMSQMIESSETQTLKAQLQQAELAKQQAEVDLQKTESAFADLHHKYEKSKEAIANLKKNEGTLKGAFEQAQAALKQSEERFAALKELAEKKIMTANEEISGVREQYKSQIQLLTAKLKKAESETGRITRLLETKEKDNQELAAICDDLVKQLEGRAA